MLAVVSPVAEGRVGDTPPELLARMLAVVSPVAEGRVGDTPPDPHAVITTAAYTEPPYQIQQRRVTFSLQSCKGSCRIGSSESANTSNTDNLTRTDVGSQQRKVGERSRLV